LPGLALDAKADLLLVDGDPLANIKLIEGPARNLVVIMKDGRICMGVLTWCFRSHAIDCIGRARARSRHPDEERRRWSNAWARDGSARCAGAPGGLESPHYLVDQRIAGGGRSIATH